MSKNGLAPGNLGVALLVQVNSRHLNELQEECLVIHLNIINLHSINPLSLNDVRQMALLQNYFISLTELNLDVCDLSLSLPVSESDVIYEPLLAVSSAQ